MQKTCSTCKLEKDIEEFHRKTKSIDGHSYTCKDCRKIYIREDYINNKKYYLTKATASNKRHREWMDQFKIGQCCYICKETRIPCLEWHHRDRREKSFDIGFARAHRHARKKIIEEIAKCNLICANCHAILHYEERLASVD